MLVSFSSMSSVLVAAAWAAEDEEDPHSRTGAKYSTTSADAAWTASFDHWDFFCKVTFPPAFSRRCGRHGTMRSLNHLRHTFLRDLFDTFHKLLRRKLFLMDLLVKWQG